MCFSPQRRAIFQHVNFKKCSEHDSFLAFWLANVLLTTAARNFSHIGTSKSAPSMTFFLAFWLANVLLVTAACNFQHVNSYVNLKKSSETVSFLAFWEMCFSPQRRAIVPHVNFKKCSEPLNFLTFLLGNVLLATAAFNFWFLLWPHDSAPAALTSLLFDSPDTRIIKTTQHFATSLTFGAGVSSFFWFSRYWIFLLVTLLHFILFSSAFSTLHIVGSLLFKLPSIILK